MSAVSYIIYYRTVAVENLLAELMRHARCDGCHQHPTRP